MEGGGGGESYFGWQDGTELAQCLGWHDGGVVSSVSGAMEHMLVVS